MKRGFISIYVLLVLLFISVSIAFLVRQVQNNTDIESDLYAKKEAIYDAQSHVNIFYKNEFDKIKEYVLEDLKRTNVDGMSDENFQNAKLYQLTYKNKDTIIYMGRVIDTKINRKRDKIYKIASVIESGNVKAEANIYFKIKEHILIDSNSHIKYADIKDSLGKIQFKKESSIYGSIPETSPSSPYCGLVCIDNDLNLDKDLYINGILLVKGKINTNGKKLKVTGHLICDNENFTGIDYTKDYTNIINSVENKMDLIDVEVIIRKAF